MKITVLGTRGIPDVLGGVETHCQHLYPQLVKQFGAEVCDCAFALRALPTLFL